MGVPMIVAMLVLLGHRMPTQVAAMVVTMSRRRDRRFGNPALLAGLRLLRRLVVILVAPPLGMRNKPPQRGFVHVTRERNLRVLHARRPRVARLLRDDRRFTLTMVVSARSDGKGRDNAWCPSSTFRAWLLLRRLAQRGQYLEGQVARRAMVFIEWHTAPFVYAIAVGACGSSAQSWGS